MHETNTKLKVKHEKVMRDLFQQFFDYDARNTYYALVCDVGRYGGRYHGESGRRQVLDIHDHYYNIVLSIFQLTCFSIMALN